MSNNKKNWNKGKKPAIIDNYEPTGKKEYLDLPVEELALSEPVYAALKKAKIDTVRDIAKKKMSQMYKVQNIGKKQCFEMLNKLKKYNIGFRPEDVEQNTQGNDQTKNDIVINQKPNNNLNQNKNNTNNNQQNRNNQNNNQQNWNNNQQNRNNQNNNQQNKNNTNNNQQNKNNQNRNNQSNNQQNRNNQNKNNLNFNIYDDKRLVEFLEGVRERPVYPSEEVVVDKSTALVKFCRKGKWGYKDYKGNVVLNPIYDEAFNFSEGLACVEKDNKLGYINEKGDVVIDFIYDSATSFSEGLASVTVDEKTGYIDKDNNIVFEMKYQVATPFTDGKAFVKLDDKWGVLAKDGSMYWR